MLRCNLRDRRLDRGLTQYELEVLSGVSRHTISAYENGSSKLQVKTAVKFAIALNCTLDELFEYKRI
ncbi:helix-turn-helix transcriptional regulator [Psychrobacillus sp. OK032]|uniref:helix-turn-helix transcriptional regulator n=1 Tax=Psychrobacillus sp. OK032 TaxID=1884358 RepID=UPI000B85AAED